MRAYEFRKYLLIRQFNEADIKNHIDNVRQVEKALDKTAETLNSRDEVESQLKWHILPWKKKELLESISLYLTFRSAYQSPDFSKVKVSYKECPECGALTPLGSTYCKECGALIGKTQFSQINGIYDSIEDKWNNKRWLVIGFLAAIAIFFVSIVGYKVTAFPLVDVVGKDAGAAVSVLVESGKTKDSISFDCQGQQLTLETVENGEYMVEEQSPPAGAKVHKSTKVTLSCKDLYKERQEAIQKCRYSKLSEAEKTAKQYDYNYKTVISEDLMKDDTAEETELYVFEVKNQDDDQKTVTFNLAGKDSIVSWMTEETQKLIGKRISDANSFEDTIRCDVDYVNYEKETVYSFDDDADSYQIIGFNSFDIDDKKLVIDVDTSKHLQELELISSLKDKIPYKGMSEEYIDDTGAGKHTDELYGEVDDSKDYIWKSSDGKYDVLTVTCEDGEVVSVHKDNEEAFWQGDLPDYSVDADAIYAELERIESEKEAEAEAKAKKEEEEKQKKEDAEKDAMTVYITTGDRYHHDWCSKRGSKNLRAVTQGWAIANGYYPCNNCINGHDVPSYYYVHP